MPSGYKMEPPHPSALIPPLWGRCSRQIPPPQAPSPPPPPSRASHHPPDVLRSCFRAR
jgi:hypothetical protein